DPRRSDRVADARHRARERRDPRYSGCTQRAGKVQAARTACVDPAPRPRRAALEAGPPRGGARRVPRDARARPPRTPAREGGVGDRAAVEAATPGCRWQIAVTYCAG